VLAGLLNIERAKSSLGFQGSDAGAQKTLAFVTSFRATGARRYMRLRAWFFKRDLLGDSGLAPFRLEKARGAYRNGAYKLFGLRGQS
jgi:hypothetical protein